MENQNNGSNEAAANKPMLPTKTDEIVSQFFVGQEILTHALPIINAIRQLTNPIVNGDWVEKETIPDGYGLLIMPISKTVPASTDGSVKKRVFEHCIIAACPTLASVLHHKDKDGNPTGHLYVENAVLSAMQAKLRNGLSRTEDPKDAKLAYTVEEFITSAERGAADQGLAAYKHVAPILVKALGKHDINVNAQVLRQVLQQTVFAKALFPNVAQNVWQKVISLGKNEAIKAKQKPEIFDRWLETRDSAANDTTLADIDFNDGTEEDAA